MTGDSINLTDILTLIIHDMVELTEEFKCFDLNKILICCASNRKDFRGATYGKLLPLRFKDGSEIIKHNGRFYTIPKVKVNNMEILYIIYFYIPKFFNLSAKDKVNVMFHELFHINPEFNGDIRRMGKFKAAHGHSRKSFEEKYIEYADTFFEKIEDTPYYNFLKMNSEDIQKEFKKIKYRRMKSIKPVLLTSN
ncbi:MAG TPA: putative metallopeptidase [Spirochaetota bacterium]|nr:putative metallopeptidase [Spirochaetota bacterium]